VRTWSGFNFETIQAIPSFTDLLNLDVPATALPTPAKANLCLETTWALLDSHVENYATMVNAGLRLTLGLPHMVMRARKPLILPLEAHNQGPDFTSSYAFPSSSQGNVAYGVPHLIGSVRAFDVWNTGMRGGGCASQIAYLRGLAQLQGHMRAHNCRYGFIISEIELVCVRLVVNDGKGRSRFGLLEIADTVLLTTHGEGADGTLTACLALWYLHMLAKNVSLPGQPGWRAEVGTPGQLSRKCCGERDEWIEAIKPENKEKRNAKRNRGWILHGDPLSRRECGGGSRRWRVPDTPGVLALDVKSIR